MSPRGEFERRWIRWEYAACGKARCKRCADGRYHGPYPYLHTKIKGRPKAVRQYLSRAVLTQHEDVPHVNTPETATVPYRRGR